ncbi:hypothetical protein [Anianabacter salinae]|uniref:hypothetical protein n=1 Tax=Anianabacter salinae TaxID=2851023 RepID=UPI00225E3979|nr:hypothetical protein [Anianabacter salinae]MBV0910917.1 hypothetical protein [Anianabacter salinae]
MAKVPYGVSVHNPNEADEAWTKLATINEHLEAGEPIPPDLARWLGGAIAYSGQDPDEFLRRLGVKRGRGAARRNPDAWRVYGRRVCELEDEGMKAEEALAQVLTETDDMFSRSQLQNLRDEYRATRDAALNPE